MANAKGSSSISIGLVREKLCVFGLILILGIFGIVAMLTLVFLNIPQSDQAKRLVVFIILCSGALSLVAILAGAILLFGVWVYRSYKKFTAKNWIAVERPGYLGRLREEKYNEWDARYGGRDNWRLAWKLGDTFIDFLEVCALYEDAYFEFLSNNPLVLRQLISEAANIYDDAPSNIESGFDYSIQETGRTHIQDIAIRRAVKRSGIWFRGKELMQIRDKRGTHPLSLVLSPGQVPFHLPGLIEKPELTGWWLPGSVESFYQSNKYLQIKSRS